MNKKPFYTIELQYRAGTETKIFRIINLDQRSLKKFRDDVFICGVYRKIDGDTGEIISPFRIDNITVYRQAYFFSQSADLERPLMNPNTVYSQKK